MSAFIVASGHIDALVNALAQYDIICSDLGAAGFRDLGQKLWQENHASVNFRYSENIPTPRYQLHTTEATLNPIAALKALDCFAHQSCEHPEWTGSEAHTLITLLRTAILVRHPNLGERVNGPIGETYRYTTLRAYDDAPWLIEALDDIVTLPT